MSNQNQAHNSCVRRKPEVQVLNGAFAVPSVTEAVIWIEDGAVAAEKSRPEYAAVSADKIEGFSFESSEPCLNAIISKGEGSSVEIDKASIALSGTGCSDFTSKGAGVLTYEKGSTVIKDSEIVTNGATRCCTIATSGGTLKVYNSKLASYGGPLPEDYVPVIGPGMMEPPYPLGLGGNCRTHLSMDNSESFFYNCDIYAAAWAAVSTDAGGGYCYAEVNDSNVNCEGNGYVGYADNDCHLAFYNSRLNSGNMIFIQDGNSSIVTKNCECTCDKYGMLIHGGMENWNDIGVIDIQDSSISTVQQVMLCKSTNVDIYMKNVKLSSETGIIIESKLTDDRMYFTRRTVGPEMYGIQVTFEAMDIEGDFLMGDSERKQHLHFVNANLKGTISGNPQIWLTEGSKWTAVGTSLVTFMGDVTLDMLDAAKGPGGFGAPGDAIIYAYAGEGCKLEKGEHILSSGGKLIML